MENNIVKTYFDAYAKTTASAKTFWGFEFDGNIYGFYADDEVLLPRVRLTVSSKGEDEVLRLRSLKKIEKFSRVASGEAVLLCTAQALTETMEEYGLNKGEAFEQIFSLLNGGGFYKHGKQPAYYEQGDIKVNGEWVQIKYEDATLTKLKLIDKAIERWA